MFFFCNLQFAGYGYTVLTLLTLINGWALLLVSYKRVATRLAYSLDVLFISPPIVLLLFYMGLGAWYSESGWCGACFFCSFLPDRGLARVYIWSTVPCEYVVPSSLLNKVCNYLDPNLIPHLPS